MTTRLGDVASFTTGAAFPLSAQGRSEGEFPFAKVSDLGSATSTSWAGIKNWVSAQVLAELGARTVVRGSIVFAKIGEGLKRERFAVAQRDMAIDNNLMAITVLEEFVDPTWFRYQFTRLHVADYAVGSALPYLKQSDLAEIPISLPPLHEQRAIGEVLGALDDKIAANRRLIKIGHDVLRADWNLLAKQWREQRLLSEIAEINPSVKADELTDTYVEMSALPEHGLLVDQWTARPPKGGARFMNGDAVFARITPCFENGKAAYIDFLEEGTAASGSTEYIVFRAANGTPPIVPFLVVTGAAFREFAQTRMTGTSGRQRVQARDIGDYRVRWPEQSQVDEFGLRSETLVARLGAARDESKTLARTRDELLPLLLSGKLTVKDAEQTVEELV